MILARPVICNSLSSQSLKEKARHRGVWISNSVGFWLFGLFLKLVGSLFVLFTDFIELLHVLEEVWTPLKGDEKLCFLAVASVIGGLNCDGLGSDLLECGVVVPKTWSKLVNRSQIGYSKLTKNKTALTNFEKSKRYFHRKIMTIAKWIHLTTTLAQSKAGKVPQDVSSQVEVCTELEGKLTRQNSQSEF